MSGRTHFLNVYRPTFHRALYSYVNSGFFARDLDADDHEFIEYVRGRGRVGADSLGVVFTARYHWEEHSRSMRAAETKSRPADRSHSTFFDPEMLDYWEHRWEFEENLEVERRQSYARQKQERQEQQEQRYRDREMERAELENEQTAWKKQQDILAKERERRLLQTMLADIEWEQASTEQRKTLDPNAWHEDEDEYKYKQRVESLARKKAKKEALEAERKRKKAEAARQRKQEDWLTRGRRLHQQALQRAELKRQKEAEALAEAQRDLKRSEEHALAARRAQHVQATIMSVTSHAAQPAPQPLPASLTQYSQERGRRDEQERRLVRANEIKRAMVTAIRGSNRMWTVEDLMEVARCDDREFVLQCANELVGGGFLRPTVGAR